MDYVQTHQAKGELVTGLLYVDSAPEDLHYHLNTVEVPFNTLGEKQLCPGSAILGKINESLR
jgi:2-oxoglutarate ferredoxin oxidoreductase subunit beta